MFAITELAPGTQQPSATQLQTQLLASLAQPQRVAALAASDTSADAGMQNPSGQPNASKLLRAAAQRAGLERAHQGTTAPQNATLPTDAGARSVVEAQEQSEGDIAVTEAFQARYALTDLLSVIRDPEDQMLPNAPSDETSPI